MAARQMPAVSPTNKSDMPVLIMSGELISDSPDLATGFIALVAKRPPDHNSQRHP
jgi:hypothetical protein